MNRFLIFICIATGIFFGAATSVFAETLYFGGVEIGSKGIKASLWELKRSKEHWDPKVYHNEKFNSNLISSLSVETKNFGDAGIADAAKGTKLVLDRLYEKAAANKLNKVTYFIVGSSGVAMAANRDDLKASVKDATGLSMEFVTSDEESEYGMLAVVPNKQRAKIVLVDIGSGNTKIGYWNDQFARYVATSIPYGSVSLRDKAKAGNGEYHSNLHNLLDNEIQPDYSKVAENKPAFKNRAKIYWLGGAGWATNTFTHPESLGTSYSRLSRKDVDKFIAMVESDQWLEDSSLRNVPPKLHARATEEMKRVRDTFSKQDLLAGVGLMQTVLKESHRNPVIVFPVQNSQWIYGYVLKKIVDVN